MSDPPPRECPPCSGRIAANFVRAAARSCARVSRYSDQYDQELDSLLVGPIPVGINKFVFEADAPNTKRIPDAELLGVTVILLTCSYDDREFIRVGYGGGGGGGAGERAADPPAK